MPSAIKVANVYAAAYSQGNSARTAQQGFNKYDDRGSARGDHRSSTAKGFKDYLNEEMNKRDRVAR